MAARKPDSPRTGPNARALAATVVGRVSREDAFVQLALSSALERARGLSGPDKGFATELVYGTLRHLPLIDVAIEKAAQRRLKKIDDVLVDAARVATYEALYLHGADHALVNEAVNNARRLRGDGAAKFLNGVLRGLLRLRDSGVLLPSSAPGIEGLMQRTGLPHWLAEDVSTRLGPEEAEAFGMASLRKPDIHLCVPDGEPVRAKLIDELHQLGTECLAHPMTPTGIVLESASSAIDALMLGDDPRALIQNAASQLVALWAVHVARERKADRVIDLCAAPGGKSAVIARHGFTVISGDVHVDKLHQARDQWNRLKVNPLAVGLDAAQPPFAPACVDAILLDAPCTGSGLLNRRPEIKLRRGAEDLARLVELQSHLLDAAALVLRPGGSMIYSVCSVSSAEGPEQARAFLARHPDFSTEPYPASLPERAVTGGALTLWPHLHGTDGFYAVHLRKQR